MKNSKAVSVTGARQSHGSARTSKKKWQREQLILAMLQQPTWQKAAAAIGVSEVTAWRIRQTPEFQQEYLAARREAVSQSLARLQQASSAAVGTLLKILLDPTTPVSTRLQAASRVLDYAKSALSLDDLELRIGRAAMPGAEGVQITVTYVQQND